MANLCSESECIWCAGRIESNWHFVIIHQHLTIISHWTNERWVHSMPLVMIAHTLIKPLHTGADPPSAILKQCLMQSKEKKEILQTQHGIQLRATLTHQLCTTPPLYSVRTKSHRNLVQLVLVCKWDVHESVHAFAFLCHFPFVCLLLDLFSIQSIIYCSLAFLHRFATTVHNECAEKLRLKPKPRSV